MELLAKIILVVLLVLSVYFDLRIRKIPNKITAPAALTGIVLGLILSGIDGLVFSGSGLLFGLLVFIIPYMLGGMGAGDVKLMAAIGALMGWEFTLRAALGTAVVGGVMVILYMLYKRQLGSTLLKTVGLILVPLAKGIYGRTFSPRVERFIRYFEKQKSISNPTYIPYAVAIASGSMLVLLGAFGNF